MADVKQLEELATQVRRDVLRMVHAVQSGHPGGSLSSAEYMVALYGEMLKFDKKFEMDARNEDIFILSNGHISPLLYSVLARNGFFEVEELKTFRKLNSRLQGHPSTHDKLPGVRIASGSLGQGLSVAIGAALTKKLNHDDYLVYSLHGDGELQEGQPWEAIMYAGAKGVDNLIATVDYNKQQIDGSTDDVLSLGNLREKLEAFGWKVVEEDRGNDMQAVLNALKTAKGETKKGKPVFVLLHTDMGHGVDFMSGTNAWHGKAPNDEQLKNALSQLNTTQYKDY